jgi:hypothetical protein
MDESGEIHVFLSYAAPDRGWARQLSEALEAAGVHVLDPASEVLPGDNIHLEIGRALDRSEAMVVLISPQSNESSWVQQEIQYALGSEKFQDRLIPVEVEPTDGYPWVLRHLPWVTGGPSEAGRRIAEMLKHRHTTNAGAH